MIGTMRADVRAEESYRHVAVPIDPLAITEAEAAQRLRACGGGEGVEVRLRATQPPLFPHDTGRLRWRSHLKAGASCRC